MQYVTTGCEGLVLELCNMSPLGGRGWSRNYAICHHWVGEAGVRTMQYVTSGWEGLE